VLQINGSPTDAAAGLIKKGIHRRSDKERLQDTGRIRHAGLGAAKGTGMGRGQITRFGARRQGRVAANDGTGGGAIAAFKAAGVKPVPPSPATTRPLRRCS
jgi:D-xylose transport system substrate-binding protein